MSGSPILIIPARGGSKRLPRKNILDLDGMSVLDRVISTAKSSSIFSKIIVSTEDPEIAKIAKASGAEVFIRSDENAGDRSSVASVCLEVLETIECDFFCCIYPTAALLSVNTIQQSWAQVCSNPEGINGLMGVSEYNFPPVQALTVNEEGYAELTWPELGLQQSQFYPEMVVSNGSIYWVKKSAFQKEKTFYGSLLKTFIVPENEVCDVNTVEDIKILESKYSANKQDKLSED